MDDHQPQQSNAEDTSNINTASAAVVLFVCGATAGGVDFDVCLRIVSTVGGTTSESLQ